MKRVLLEDVGDGKQVGCIGGREGPTPGTRYELPAAVLNQSGVSSEDTRQGPHSPCGPYQGVRQASAGWELQVLINIPSCTGRPRVSTVLRSRGSDRRPRPAEWRWRSRHGLSGEETAVLGQDSAGFSQQESGVWGAAKKSETKQRCRRRICGKFCVLFKVIFSANSSPAKTCYFPCFWSRGCVSFGRDSILR